MSVTDTCSHGTPTDISRFDSCYGSGVSQEDVFAREVEPLLAHAVRGHNASCFAFGPTGAGISLADRVTMTDWPLSGKTFTMQGTEDSPGLLAHGGLQVLTLTQALSREQLHIYWT